MSEFKNGDLVEAFFFPDIWVNATFIGIDGKGYVVRTVNGYKCSTEIRKRNSNTENRMIPLKTRIKEMKKLGMTEIKVSIKELEKIINKREEYATQKCEEQRSICAEYFPPIKGYSNVYDDIKNAPLATDK